MKDADDKDVVFCRRVQNQVLACDEVSNAGAKVIARLARKRMVAQLLYAVVNRLQQTVGGRWIFSMDEQPDGFEVTLCARRKFNLHDLSFGSPDCAWRRQ